MSIRLQGSQRLAATLMALVLALILTSPVAARQQVPAEPVLSAEGISEYALDNGMRVVLFPDSTKPVTTVNVTYLVGSRHENYGETGMAHLLEHLVFKGTPTNEDIPGGMRQRGVRFNGTTWLDRTNYFASFATNPNTLEWLLQMEADRMVNSHISREDLDSEMTVVRNEMEMGENSPVGVMMQRLFSTAYLWHNYAKTTIGARSDVENVPIDRLQAFYRTWYQPDNAVLVVAGDFDPAATLQAVAASFGAIPRPERALPATYTTEPPQDGEREVVVRRVGETPFLGLAYHIPAGRHPDSAAIAVLGQVLAHSPTGRMHRGLVEPGKAAAVQSLEFSMDQPGLMMFLASAVEGIDLDGLQADMLALIEARDAGPFTEEEVAEARQRILTGMEMAMRDPNAIGVALSEAIAQGDWRLLLLSRDLTEQVTADDVNRVAQAYLQRNNRTAARFIPTQAPERVEIPAAPDAATLLADYQGREAMAAGEAFDPSPANIDVRTAVATLDNQAELAVLAKSTRGESVQVRIDMRLGDEASLIGRGFNAELVPGMLTRGTEGLDRAAISRRLTGLKSALNVGGSATSASLVATTDRDNLPALLELAASILRNPTFPESEFEQLRTQVLTSIRDAVTDPQAVASSAMNRYFDRWPEGHPHASMTFEEQIQALQAVELEDVRAFHRDFYGTAGASIAIVGDVDAEAVQAQVDELFGDWNARVAFTRIPTPHHAMPAVREQLETPDKANAMLLAHLRMPVGQDHGDYAALVAGNQILGGGTKSRLYDRIRQREGLSYAVGSAFAAEPLDEAGHLTLYALAAPENVAAVEVAIAEELALLLEEGIGEEELREAVDGMLESRRTSRASDGALAGMLSSNLYLDRTMADAAKFEDDLRAQTPDSVHAALRRHLRPAEISYFVAGDFEAAEGKAPARVPAAD
ncbi:M16 family metallopeptidase [Luteimonas sp. A277]